MRKSEKTSRSNVGKSVRVAYFQFLAPIASAIQQAFGPTCEVVLHDFEDPEHSIVWIKGNVTGRRVGGGVSEIGLKMIQEGDSASNRIAIVRNSRDGKIIKDTTILLRDQEGRVFGCMCINVDVTDLLVGLNGLSSLVGKDSEIPEIPFSDQIGEVLSGMIRDAEREIGPVSSTMGRQENRRFIECLEKRGAFTVKRSVSTVAKYLRASRATVYNYLKEIRNSHGMTTPQRNWRSREVGAPSHRGVKSRSVKGENPR